MKYFVALFVLLPIVISITLLSSPSHAISSCNGPCGTLNDCAGQLICTHGRCRDDPNVGTQTCPNTPSSSDGGCQPLGTIRCGGTSYPRYRCSPPVTSSTRATLTNNDFTSGGGSGPSECDGRFHKNSELIVALSTGWYAGGSRCGDKIKITSTKTRRSVLAKVVDECDSTSGCPPCRNDDVDGSSAVWHALGLDIGVGVEPITWSMA